MFIHIYIYTNIQILQELSVCACRSSAKIRCKTCTGSTTLESFGQALLSGLCRQLKNAGSMYMRAKDTQAAVTWQTWIGGLVHGHACRWLQQWAYVIVYDIYMHPHAAMQHQPLSQQPEAGTHFQISRFGGGTYCGPEVFGGGATSTPAPHLPSAPPLPPFLGIRFGLALPFSSLTVPSGGSSINTSSCSLSSSNSFWSSCFSSSLCSALTSMETFGGSATSSSGRGLLFGGASGSSPPGPFPRKPGGGCCGGRGRLPSCKCTHEHIYIYMYRITLYICIHTHIYIYV